MKLILFNIGVWYHTVIFSLNQNWVFSLHNFIDKHIIFFTVTCNMFRLCTEAITRLKH